MRLEVVHVAERSFAGPLAAPEFLANPALDVFGQIVGVVFALPECNLEHEQTLWSWLKPKRRKAQSNHFLDVDRVDNLSAIDAISGQSVRVPRDDADRFFADMNLRHHFIKDWPSRLLCTFALGKCFDNLDVFSFRIVSQLYKLRLYAHNLTFFVFARLTGIEKIFGFHLFTLLLRLARDSIGCLWVALATPEKLEQQNLFCKRRRATLNHHLTNKNASLAFGDRWRVLFEKSENSSWLQILNEARTKFENDV